MCNYKTTLYLIIHTESFTVACRLMYNIVVKKLSYVPALCYPVYYLHSTGMSVPVIPETLPGIDHAEVSTE